MRLMLTFTMVVLMGLGFAAVARADATETYNKKCAGCHGKDGKAQTAMGKKLGMKDLTDPKIQAAAKDADWTRTITDGVKDPAGKVVMPASAGKLSPDEIKALVKLCRDFKGK